MLALEDLIARLEREAGTPGTPTEPAGVPAKPAQTVGGTPGTPGTPKNDNAERASAPDPGEWRGEVEHEPEPKPGKPDWWHPKPLPAGSLVARLCAAGATVRSYSTGQGGIASIEAPAGIPAELVREVEARGWRIIPGGRPNRDAEHDSWLGGVSIHDLKGE
jgi:hypothetical protein